MSRRRQTRDGKPKLGVATDRLSHICEIDGRRKEVEVAWSSTPFDPALWGDDWRVDRLGPGWLALRIR